MQGSDGLYKRMASPPFFKETAIDPDLEQKAKRAADKLSETVNIIANEPSLAFFRIQEHVRKTLPQLVDQKHEVEDIQVNVQGACFDADYASNAVKAMLSSAMHFQNIQDLLKNAMFMKQQISYADNRRKFGRPSPSSSFASVDRVKENEADKRDSSDETVSENVHNAGAGSSPGGSSQNGALNLPKKSLEDSDDGREVEMFMSNPSIQT
ncbi:hypothetical protein BsWGS_05144 [Bradybaena similaris]